MNVFWWSREQFSVIIELIKSIMNLLSVFTTIWEKDFQWRGGRGGKEEEETPSPLVRSWERTLSLALSPTLFLLLPFFSPLSVCLSFPIFSLPDFLHLPSISYFLHLILLFPLCLFLFRLLLFLLVLFYLSIVNTFTSLLMFPSSFLSLTFSPCLLLFSNSSFFSNSIHFVISCIQPPSPDLPSSTH